MKEKTFFMVLLIISVFVFSKKTYASDININMEFSNESVKKYLSEYYDINNNGILEDGENNKVKKIGIEIKSENDLEEITKLKNIEDLYISSQINFDTKPIDNMINIKEVYLDLKNVSDFFINAQKKMNVLSIESDDLKTLDISLLSIVQEVVMETPSLLRMKDRYNKTGDLLIKNQCKNPVTIIRAFKKCTTVNLEEIKGCDDLIIDRVNSVKNLNVTGGKCNYFKIANCKNIQNINLGDLRNSKVVVDNCPKLNGFLLSSLTKNSIAISKCKSVKKIEIDNKKKVKLIKLKNLNKLKKLTVTGKKVSQLKLSKMPQIKNIKICNAILKSINLKNSKKIRNLVITKTGLKTIKLYKKNRIRNIDVSHNKLKRIDVNVLKKVFTMNISNNKLSGVLLLPNINKKNNVVIKCNGNRIKKIINHKNNDIYTLDCRKNKLKIVDLKNSSVHNFDCRSNKKVIVYYSWITYKNYDKKTRFIKKY